MKTVTQLIAGKPSAIWTVEPAQPVLDAIKCMAEKTMLAKLFYAANHQAKHQYQK